MRRARNLGKRDTYKDYFRRQKKVIARRKTGQIIDAVLAMAADRIADLVPLHKKLDTKGR